MGGTDCARFAFREVMHGLRRKGSAHSIETTVEQTLTTNLLQHLWPGIPLLCKGAKLPALAKLLPNTDLLPCTDQTINLPDTLISLKGLDTSPLLTDQNFGLVGISVGVISDSRLRTGMAMLLNDGLLYHTGINGQEGTFVDTGNPITFSQQPLRPLAKYLIGFDDNEAADPAFRELVLNKLFTNRNVRYIPNVPSVTGAIEVLRGNLTIYVTSNARNWDIAGTAALCAAAGIVVRCLDGSPIPWNRVRMPPVVFARDEEAFEHVHGHAKEYLNR